MAAISKFAQVAPKGSTQILDTHCLCVFPQCHPVPVLDISVRNIWAMWTKGALVHQKELIGMPSVSVNSGLEGGMLLWEQDSLGMKEASTAGSSGLLYAELPCLFYGGSPATTHVFQERLLCWARERVWVSQWADVWRPWHNAHLSSRAFSSALPKEAFPPGRSQGCGFQPSAIQSR